MTDATGQEVSLIERLRKVPALSRLVIDDGEYSTTYIPVGVLMHKAADKIDEQAAEIEELKHDLVHEPRMLKITVGCRRSLVDPTELVVSAQPGVLEDWRKAGLLVAEHTFEVEE